MPIKALSSNCPIRRQQTTRGLHVDREDPLVLLLVDLAGGRELAHGSAGPQRLARSAAGRFELVPDAGDGGDVLVVERVDEVFLNRLLEGAGDGLGSVYPGLYTTDGGFYDAVNPATGIIGHRRLVLDQSMIMAAIDNALNDNAIQRDFARDPVSWAAKIYLSMETMSIR